MQNLENNFEILIKEACAALGLPYQQLAEKYKDYPYCLIDYIEKGICDPVIEVRFDEQLATLSFNFDENKSCIASFLFFDKPDDEDALIGYLKDTQYDFKRSCWITADCYLQTKPSVDSWSFYFSK